MCIAALTQVTAGLNCGIREIKAFRDMLLLEGKKINIGVITGKSNLMMM